MRNFQLLASNVDVFPLLSALFRADKSYGLWMPDVFMRKGHAQGPEGHVESVILRWPFSYEGDLHENSDTIAFDFLSEARPLVQSLMALVKGERLGRVIINRIKPGGRTYVHADEPVHSSYYDRYHVVLQASATGNVFTCGDEQVAMQRGEVWWFNNKLLHEVVNNSDDDRLHLIIDIRTRRCGIDTGIFGDVDISERRIHGQLGEHEPEPLADALEGSGS